MIALMVAAALFVPGPDDPVCEPWQTVEVDRCSQGQLPGETIGRQVDAEPGPVSPAAVPVERVELAVTGVPVVPYALFAGALVCAGAGARRWSTSRR